jgi:hypothetical protein
MVSNEQHLPKLVNMTKSSKKAGATEGGHKRMFRLFKSRRALSEVVTTLIILVVSVLLASVVTFFAINVVSTRVQEESLDLLYEHVWYSTTDQKAEAAIMITNTGGRDVVLDKIAIRGQQVPWSDVYVYTPGTNETLNDLYYANYTAPTPPATSGSPKVNLPMTGTFAATATGSPLVLKSGNTIVIYMVSEATSTPGSVSVNDVGLTIAMSVFTAQATYYKETNVNAVGP